MKATEAMARWEAANQGRGGTGNNIENFGHGRPATEEEKRAWPKNALELIGAAVAAAAKEGI